ncbi:MAG: glycerophosphodiester phosphodiesterase [Candidatus Sumerlaeota bacterium]|nr:glycerophosphodiester phosphodiesterase [Candidatus Sumerlaeota bacterium]
MLEIIAHRGASFDAPENTLAAFKLAWRQSADGIEGDFRLTRDGKIVCSHDATTERTGDKTLEIAQSTFAQLRQVDAGGWKGAAWKGERIPTIEEVLAIVPRGKKIYIEIKAPNEIAIIKRALAQSSLKPKQIVIISFEKAEVAVAKREIAGIKTLWLTTIKKDKATGARNPPVEEILATLKEIKADGLDCEGNDAVDREFVRKFQDAGFEFHVWTIDKADEARRFASFGVNSITTNRPQWIRERLANNASAAKSSKPAK